MMTPALPFAAIITLLLTILSPTMQAQQAAPPRFPEDLVKKLDAEVTRQIDKKNLPGVVVAIRMPGQGSYLAARGKANLETGQPRRLDESLRIASITKTFVATAVLQLIDRGQIHKTDTINKWFPDFPRGDQITVGNLLAMRSGISDPVDHPFMKEYYRNPLMDLGPDDLIGRARDRADRFTAPDKRTRYTELNYILLGEIIRRVTGKEPGVQIQETVLAPLGMKHTFWPTDARLPGDLHGYGWNRTTKKFEDKTLLNPKPAGGAGAMISTVPDLEIFARALYRGDLLKPETQKERLQLNPLVGAPPWVQYGEGIGRFGHFYGHNGGIWGFSTDMFYLPEKDATIVISVNRNDEDEYSQSDPLFFALTKILFPELVNW